MVRKKEESRNYGDGVQPRVREFYSLNHTLQTVDLSRERACDWLMNDDDRRLLEWVNKFNPYDLNSKAYRKPDADALRPYYQDLIAEYFPDRIRW